MQIKHQIVLTVARHSMTQDMVLHSAADVDGIDLHKAKITQSLLHIRKASIEPCCQEHEAACDVRCDLNNSHGGKDDVCKRVTSSEFRPQIEQRPHGKLPVHGICGFPL